MMKREIALALMFIGVVLSTNSQTSSQRILKGFNQNWSMLPPLSDSMLQSTKTLKPQILRYPGGTVTHFWNWTSGTMTTRKTTAHPIVDVKKMHEATGADFVIVLDIVNSTLHDQIEMLYQLNKNGIEIKYIELGNELYADEYKSKIENGRQYALKANAWITSIRKHFPSAKIAVCLQCRKAETSNERLATWNEPIVAIAGPRVDAYTFHIYIAKNKSFSQRKSEFEKTVQGIQLDKKELWITEYGNQNSSSDPNYLISLDSLANYVESHPYVTLSLNHQLFGKHKNKINYPDCMLTAEGLLFRRRVR